LSLGLVLRGSPAEIQALLDELKARTGPRLVFVKTDYRRLRVVVDDSAPNGT
jgi:hypothetical protein